MDIIDALNGLGDRHNTIANNQELLYNTLEIVTKALVYQNIIQEVNESEIQSECIYEPLEINKQYNPGA